MYWYSYQFCIILGGDSYYAMIHYCIVEIITASVGGV
jgi:hypothetical protein